MCDITLAVNLSCALLKDQCIAVSDCKAGVCAFYKQPFGDYPPQQSAPSNEFQTTTALTAIISRQELCNKIC